MWIQHFFTSIVKKEKKGALIYYFLYEKSLCNEEIMYYFIK